MKNKILKFVILIIVLSMLANEIGSCISYATDDVNTAVPPTVQTPEPEPEPTPDPTPTPEPTPEPDPEPSENETTNTPAKNEVTSNTTNNTSSENNTIDKNNTVNNNVVDKETTNTTDEEVVEQEDDGKKEHIVNGETNYDRGETKNVDLSKIGIKNLKIYAIDGKGKKTKVSLEEEFEMQGYNYTCKVDENVEKLEFEYTESNNDIKVEIVGNEDLKKSNNTVIILARDTSVGRIATYQIKVLKDIEEVSNESDDTNENIIVKEEIVQEDENTSFFERHKTIIIVAVILIILIIFIIILKVKQNKDYGKGKRIQNKNSRGRREKI